MRDVEGNLTITFTGGVGLKRVAVAGSVRNVAFGGPSGCYISNTKYSRLKEEPGEKISLRGKLATSSSFEMG